MWCAPALAVLAGAGPGDSTASNRWPLALSFLVLWVLAPVAAWWISQPAEKKAAGAVRGAKTIPSTSARAKPGAISKRSSGRKTIGCRRIIFRNIRRPIIASRTSPTNIGLALLCTLAAWDFGYLSVRQLTDRLANTLADTGKTGAISGPLLQLVRHTHAQAAATRFIVSTVDNGNFAGFLLTLRSGLLELAEQPWPTRPVVLRLARHVARVAANVCRKTIRTPTATESVRCWHRSKTKLANPPSSLLEAYGCSTKR